MYFGTLITPTRHDHEQETWQRDLDSANVATQPRLWRRVWAFICRWPQN